VRRFEAFVPDATGVAVGEERVLALRDLTPGRGKYGALHARVRLLAPDDPDADGELQVRTRVGHLVPGRWRLRILQRLDGLIPGTPYGDAFVALEAASGSRKGAGEDGNRD
jgi:hypothetical protein